ncbi:hypothetical protein OTERR_15070 [Oryzomicrobium terrae]|uniref:Uncharacterized protein n=1 Tax=Oryzomicrobium terrae TaxID=1735038 RepID=A0A5C1E7Y8_9RHOO|nr:hypothetical protein [Oryzomicrobium terrae]QEL64983.1 hypothetical protein OTERR_15070 [Oryzomicrobium terrae]
MVAHCCPVCGQIHDVPDILDRLSYGRQMTCSPACKAALRQVVRRRILDELAQRQANAMSPSPPG